MTSIRRMKASAVRNVSLAFVVASSPECPRLERTESVELSAEAADEVGRLWRGTSQLSRRSAAEPALVPMKTGRR